MPLSRAGDLLLLLDRRRRGRADAYAAPSAQSSVSDTDLTELGAGVPWLAGSPTPADRCGSDDDEPPEREPSPRRTRRSTGAGARRRRRRPPAADRAPADTGGAAEDAAAPPLPPHGEGEGPLNAGDGVGGVTAAAADARGGAASGGATASADWFSLGRLDAQERRDELARLSASIGFEHAKGHYRLTGTPTLAFSTLGIAGRDDPPAAERALLPPPHVPGGDPAQATVPPLRFPPHGGPNMLQRSAELQSRVSTAVSRAHARTPMPELPVFARHVTPPSHLPPAASAGHGDATSGTWGAPGAVRMGRTQARAVVKGFSFRSNHYVTHKASRILGEIPMWQART